LIGAKLFIDASLVERQSIHHTFFRESKVVKCNYVLQRAVAHQNGPDRFSSHESLLSEIMPIYKKYRGDRAYLYEQHSYREGKKVRTWSRYLGPENGDPFALEPGEVQADKAVTEWTLAGGPEKLAQEQPQWSQADFLAETSSATTDAPTDAAPDGGAQEGKT
jgi:hypothetical protein